MYLPFLVFFGQKFFHRGIITNILTIFGVLNLKIIEEMALDSLLTKTQPMLSDSLSIKESLAQRAEQLVSIDFGQVMTTLINQGTRVVLNILIALVV